jgi:peroxiredoxin
VRAPISNVTLHTGESVSLESLYKQGGLVLNFLRHLGCVFCREQIAELRKVASDRLVMVSMADVTATASFRDKMESPQAYISDPNKGLYEQFGLKKGTFGQVMGSGTISRGLRALARGHGLGKPVGDPLMLAGTFLINRSGEVVYSHFAASASDSLPGSEIAKLLEREI